ncbi:MAG: hypothetical protein ACTHOU_10170 [Aureliella sp.]|jgi:copper chaperone CopZ
MRRFAIGTMLVLGLAAAGCEKPVEGIPSSSGSAVSSGDDLSVEMPAEDTAPPAVDTTAPPATDAVPPAGEPAPATEPSPTTDPAPATDAPKTDEAAPAAETPKQSSTGGSSAKFVAMTDLKVPTMSCPHGCWPTVKETLAAQPGVESVELAKQSNADAIDNPVVHVKLNGKFDSKAAVAALAKAGFENAEVVN